MAGLTQLTSNVKFVVQVNNVLRSHARNVNPVLWARSRLLKVHSPARPALTVHTSPGLAVSLNLTAYFALLERILQVQGLLKQHSVFCVSRVSIKMALVVPANHHASGAHRESILQFWGQAVLELV